MRPTRVLRFKADTFSSQYVCLGSQVAKVVDRVGVFVPELRWYMADVEYIGAPSIARTPTPIAVGNTYTFVRFARRVEQFVSGVFVGVSAHIADPQFRQGGLWTEDEEASDLGDAMVEVRSFDFTYISVASTDEALLVGLETEFVAQ